MAGKRTRSILKGWVQLLMSLSVICISFQARAQEGIKYFTTPTLPFPAASDHAYFVDFADSLGGDTLYQVRAENGYPVSYHRKIKTSVCFDNKCRLLNIVIHWNVTGRYLGFALPVGEYLSKAEHKPFTQQEYARLHGLLGDPNSPLGSFSYNELVPAKAETNPEIDAVSSPTAKNLLEFVVEGAAYTTYKLWHIIHGTTRDEVGRLTTEALSPDLWLDILASSDVSDKIWALNHRQYIEGTSSKIQASILSYVTSDEFTLAERAIHAIASDDLGDEKFQVQLLQKLDAANYSLRKRMIEKLGDAPGLSVRSIHMLAEKLVNVSGELVSTIFEVLSEREVTDMKVARHVAMLLTSENAFISRQAYDFLMGMELEDREIQNALKEYKVKRGL